MVEDTSPPVLTNIPTNVIIDSNNGGIAPSPPTNINATDNCDSEVDIAFSEDTQQNGCETIITRTWTATDNCGNTDQGVQVITITGPFEVSISPSSITACEGEEISINVISEETPGGYQWSSDHGTFDDPTISNPSFTSDGSQNATINLTVTTASGCVGVASTIITFHEPPIANAFANGPICEGEDITLFASGGTSYQWSGPNGILPSIQNPVISNSTPNQSGDYTVTVTNDHGCSTIQTVNVLVTDRISGDYSVIHADCENSGSIILGVIGGTGNYSFNWNPCPTNGPTPQPQNRFDLDPGTYSITVQDEVGCEVIFDDLMVENECNQVECNDLLVSNITTINAECGLENGSITVNIVGNENDYTFNWSNGNTGSSISNLTSGSHQVTISDATTMGCDTILNITIENQITEICFTTDTVTINTPFETPTDTICLDLSEIGSDLSRMTTCETPGFGTLIPVNDSCLVYTPAVSYTHLTLPTKRIV